jgi:toxin-antitoxin system PIN domain toxin
LRALFDVNFLIALLQPRHVHHARAHDWWNAHSPNGWASCAVTQNGFVRVVSQLRAEPPIYPSEARMLLVEQLARPDHEFWVDDLSIADAEIFDFDHVLTAKHLSDIYLLALAVSRGGCLVTFDRHIPLNAVRNAGAHHLVVL